MAENRRMTAAQLADKLISSEHADVVRESVAWMVAELMEAEVAPRSAPRSARSRLRSAQRSATATARADGTRVPAPSSCRFQKLRQGSYFPLLPRAA